MLHLGGSYAISGVKISAKVFCGIEAYWHTPLVQQFKKLRQKDIKLTVSLCEVKRDQQEDQQTDRTTDRLLMLLFSLL